MKLDIVERDSELNYGVKIVASSEKWGAINKDDKVIIPLIFDSIERLNSKYYLVAKEDKKGLYTSYGKETLPVIYKEVDFVPNDRSIILCDESDNYFLCDLEGKRIFKNNYQGLRVYDRSSIAKTKLYIAKKDGKYGVIDKEEKTVIAFEYNMIIYCSALDCFTTDINEEFYIRDKAGELILPSLYEEIDIYEGGFHLVTTNRTSGKKMHLFYDNSFNLVKWIDNSETYNKQCYDDLISYFEDGKTVIFNLKTKKEFKLDFLVSDIRMVSEDIYCVKNAKDKQYGLVNSQGKEIQSFIFDDVCIFKDDFGVAMHIRIGSSWGVCSAEGDIVIWPRYQRVERVCSDGKYYFAVKSDELWGLLDSTGTLLLETIYDDLPRISDEYSRYAVVSYKRFPGVVYF